MHACIPSGVFLSIVVLCEDARRPNCNEGECRGGLTCVEKPDSDECWCLDDVGEPLSKNIII